MTEMIPSPSEGNFLFYATEDGVTRVRLLVDGQTVWMPQKAIAELFDTTVANINTHIRNILSENELQKAAVIKEYLITASDGKNYLSQDEISELNRIVTMYLDFAEDQARRKRTMTMAQWVGRLDAFLEFNERDVLQHAGKVQKAVADRLALEQFEQYQLAQTRIEATQPTSDFDRFVDDLKRLEPPPEDKPDE